MNSAVRRIDHVIVLASIVLVFLMFSGVLT